MSSPKINKRDDGIFEIRSESNEAESISITVDDAILSSRNTEMTTFGNSTMADIESRFNDKVIELKRYIIGTGIGVASLLLAAVGLIITVQQIYGTGQDRVSDARYETIITKLGNAEEYFKATGERQELFKQAVNNSVKSIENEVKDNRNLINTVIEQQQRTNAALDKLVDENK